MDLSVCIPAYNEEKNIASLLKSFANQQTSKVHIKEMVVVASGCTDKTVGIVKKLQSSIPHLKLIIQKNRAGKASAVNTFLKEATEDICVVSGADILLQPHTIEQLCLPLQDKEVGMTGGHPIPINKPNRFIDYAVHILWELHHKVALKNPKCGEIIAFHKIFDHILRLQPPLTKPALKRRF